MKFQDIFKEPGLYVGKDFSEGYCFKVDKSRVLKTVTYKDRDDLNPIVRNALMFGELFNIEYKKVYTRQSLFK